MRIQIECLLYMILVVWFNHRFLVSYNGILFCVKKKKENKKKVKNECYRVVRMKNSMLVNFLLFHIVTTTIQHTDTDMGTDNDEPPCMSLTIHNIPVLCVFLCGIRAHHHIKPYSSFRCSFFFWSRFENPKIQTLHHAMHVECITTIYDDDGGINHCVFLVKLMFAWSIFPSFLSLTLAQCWLSQPSFAFTLLGFWIVCELRSFFYICAVPTENMEYLTFFSYDFYLMLVRWLLFPLLFHFEHGT